jgi:hypothetical protein
MGKKGIKILEKWRTGVPRDVRWEEVRNVLDTFFEGKWRQNRSSHVTVGHEKLIRFPEYQPYGELSIPIKGGKTVKKFYVQRLIRAIDALEAE